MSALILAIYRFFRRASEIQMTDGDNRQHLLHQHQQQQQQHMMMQQQQRQQQFQRGQTQG